MVQRKVILLVERKIYDVVMERKIEMNNAIIEIQKIKNDGDESGKYVTIGVKESLYHKTDQFVTLVLVDIQNILHILVIG